MSRLPGRGTRFGEGRRAQGEPVRTGERAGVRGETVSESREEVRLGSRQQSGGPWTACPAHPPPGMSHVG